MTSAEKLALNLNLTPEENYAIYQAFFQIYWETLPEKEKNKMFKRLCVKLWKTGIYQ